MWKAENLHEMVVGVCEYELPVKMVCNLLDLECLSVSQNESFPLQVLLQTTLEKTQCVMKVNR